MNFYLKRCLHFAGGVLGLIGVVFVAVRMNTYSVQINLDNFELTTWILLALFASVYGAVNIFLSLAWWNILVFLNVKVGRKWAIKSYGLSQLAKYVPGNIFHLAGRQALGMAIGLPGRALAKSALWELVIIAVAGSFYGLLVVPQLWADLSVPTSVVMFGMISVGSVIVLRRFLSPSISVALIWQLSFLMVSGVLFLGVLAIVSPAVISFSALPLLSGAYVIAWLAGLVTPGAPAGVGVRELVLLFLLKGFIAEADLLLAVVLGRMVTVSGDLLIYLFSLKLDVASYDKAIVHD